jgi:hypothetical protein
MCSRLAPAWPTYNSVHSTSRQAPPRCTSPLTVINKVARVNSATSSSSSASSPFRCSWTAQCCTVQQLAAQCTAAALCCSLARCPCLSTSSLRGAQSTPSVVLSLALMYFSACSPPAAPAGVSRRQVRSSLTRQSSVFRSVSNPHWAASAPPPAPHAHQHPGLTAAAGPTRGSCTAAAAAARWAPSGAG